MGGGGRLPPVEERLPEDPLVILPSEQNGLYGGTLKRYGTSPRDVGIFGHRLAYDGLVRWGPIGKEVRPNLARRWEMSEGGRTFTFWLRRGVRWSDGHSFTSDDIVFWYEDVLQSPELTPVRINEYYRAGELMQLEKLDAHTLRIRFKEPYGIFWPTWRLYPTHIWWPTRRTTSSNSIPAIGIVHNSRRNVPKVALSSWLVRTPGNTAPESWAIVE